MGIFLADGQLVVDGNLRQAAADGLDGLHRKAGTVLGAAAVFIRAVVKDSGAEAAAHAVTVDLHHIEPGFDSQHGGLAEAVDDLMDLAGGQLADVRGNLGIQQGTQLLHGNLLRQNAGHVFQHGQHIGVGLVQLGADAAVIAVDDFDQLLIMGEAFFIKKRFLKLAFADGDVTDDNHGAAACGDLADLFKVFVLRKAKGGRGKNDTVFQFQTAVIDGAVNRFVHGAVSFLLLFPIRQAAVPFLSQSDSS